MIENLKRYKTMCAAEALLAVDVLAGDLEKLSFGLPQSVHDGLLREVTHIFHCASLVHYVYPYSRMRAPNVGGTAEVLRFAREASLAPALHHVSTLSVFPFNQFTGADPVTERSVPGPAIAPIHGGYAQSKSAAEHLVLAASAEGLRVSVHRPARVAGESITGSGADDLLWKVVQLSLATGQFPDLTWTVDMWQVDHLAEAILRLSFASTSTATDPACRVFHYYSPSTATLADVCTWIMEKVGCALRAVPYAEWAAGVQSHLQKVGTADPLYGLRTLFPANLAEFHTCLPFPLAPSIDCSDTVACLQGVGMSLPEGCSRQACEAQWAAKAAM